MEKTYKVYTNDAFSTNTELCLKMNFLKGKYYFTLKNHSILHFHGRRKQKHIWGVGGTMEIIKVRYYPIPPPFPSL